MPYVAYLKTDDATKFVTPIGDGDSAYDAKQVIVYPNFYGRFVEFSIASMAELNVRDFDPAVTLAKVQTESVAAFDMFAISTVNMRDCIVTKVKLNREDTQFALRLPIVDASFVMGRKTNDMAQFIDRLSMYLQVGINIFMACSTNKTRSIEHGNTVCIERFSDGSTALYWVDGVKSVVPRCGICGPVLTVDVLGGKKKAKNLPKTQALRVRGTSICEDASLLKQDLAGLEFSVVVPFQAVDVQLASDTATE
ncbi:MAG: hypothetical protein LBB38_01530 [Puniceicoccales bacterium]|jgi:hypothetical protein|nr:hypothetical protein [Puniceicoccales bacterium]